MKEYREVFGARRPRQWWSTTAEPVCESRPRSYNNRGQEGRDPPAGPGGLAGGGEGPEVVKSERGKTEGSIGRLKSRKYGFSHRQERCVETQDAAGQRAIVSVNLNTLMRDVVTQAKSARLARD